MREEELLAEFLADHDARENASLMLAFWDDHFDDLRFGKPQAILENAERRIRVLLPKGVRVGHTVALIAEGALRAWGVRRQLRLPERTLDRASQMPIAAVWLTVEGLGAELGHGTMERRLKTLQRVSTAARLAWDLSGLGL